MVAQTFKDFEILVCDDGSTDKSRDIVASFETNLNIRYFWNENWGGPARPRNVGIKNAIAEWICFLDSDDWWYPDKLQKMLEYLQQYDIIYHDLDMYSIEVKARGVVKGWELKNNTFLKLLIKGNAIPNSSVVLRKSLVDKVGYLSEDRGLIAVEDYDYWIRIATTATNRFKYIPESLGAYWIGENISASVKQIQQQINLLNKYVNDLSQKEKIMAQKMHSFRKARAYHGLGMFREANVNYYRSLTLNDISISLKSIIGIITSGCKIFL